MGNSTSKINIFQKSLIDESSKKEGLLEENEKINFVKNSHYFIKSAGLLKEFYQLLFKGIEERIKYVMLENEEMKDCIKSLINELMNIVEFKLKTCAKNLQWKNVDLNNNKNNYKERDNKLNNDNINIVLNNLNFDYSTNKINNINYNRSDINNIDTNNEKFNIEDKTDNDNIHNIIGSFRNYNVEKEKTNLNRMLELNKEDFISNLNDLLKKFREVYLYDVLKISPNDEFSFSYSVNEKQNEITDNKTNIMSLAFYKEIHEFFEYFKKGNFVEMIKNFENTIKDFDKSIRNVSQIQSPKEFILPSHKSKSNFNNEDFIFNNQGSFYSNSFRNFNINKNNNNDTIKITLRENDIDNKIPSNSNKDVHFSDFNSENFNNNIVIKLEDKIHKINSDIRLKIEELENKFILYQFL